MPWAIKAPKGLWTHAVKETKGEAIDYALEIFYDERCSSPRLDRWNFIRRLFNLSVVKVETASAVWEPREGEADDVSLALAVLRGDRQAALALADLVLETYHATPTV